MKKSILVIFLALMLVFLAACGSKTPTATPAPDATATPAPAATETPAATEAPAKPVHITYATFIGDGDKDMIGIVAKRFMELHPNVTIETQVFDHQTYQDKLAIMAKSSTLPDFFWWNGLNIVTAFDTNQSVADLTPYIDDEFKAAMTSDALVNLTNKAGKVVGFPAESQVQAWMFNKKLFADNGLQLPKTYDDLKADVAVFKKAGIVTIAEGTKDPWPTWGFEEWFTKWGVQDDAQKIFITHEYKFSDGTAPISNVFKDIAELHDLGAFPANNSTMTYEQAIALFTSGKAAMISIPSDQLGKVVGTPVEKDTELNWGIQFPDSKASQTREAGGVSNGYAVSAEAAKDPDKIAAIVALNKFRFTEEGFTLSLKAGANLPATVQVDLSTFGKIVQDQAKLISDSALKMETAVYTPYRTWGTQYWDPTGTKYYTAEAALMNALIDGSKTTKDLPAEFGKLDKLIDDINKFIKDNPKPAPQ